MGVGRERVGVGVGVKNPIADWARVLNYDCLIPVRLNTNYLNVLLPQIYLRKMDMTSMIVTTQETCCINTDIIISIVKLIVHSPVGTLV